MQYTERKSAHTMLAALTVGQPVRLTVDGRTHDMTVMQTIMRGDGGGFGSWDHATVKIGFGWGRYAVDVSAVALETGRYTLEVV